MYLGLTLIKSRVMAALWALGFFHEKKNQALAWSYPRFWPAEQFAFA